MKKVEKERRVRALEKMLTRKLKLRLSRVAISTWDTPDLRVSEVSLLSVSFMQIDAPVDETAAQILFLTERVLVDWEEERYERKPYLSSLIRELRRWAN